jgi:membrane protein DedA with SNARE-associated domain
VTHWINHLVETYGLGLLFIVIALESAGLPLPGETSLIFAGVWAAKGHLAIEEVIAVAALAAIVGDNVGYWLGRFGGRAVLDRWGPLRRFAARVLPPAERFFAKHGAKTVFLARFLAGLRVTAAWMAGISHMPWWRFLVWNAAGGIAWAIAVGLVAYYFGHAAADAIARYGLVGAGVVVGAAVLAFLGLHLWKRRMMRAEEGA